MQLAMHMVTIEDLMPQGHFLRKLEAALDLSFVYEETAPFCPEVARCGASPAGVFLFGRSFCFQGAAHR